MSLAWWSRTSGFPVRFYEKLRGSASATPATKGSSVTLQNNDCRLALFQDVLHPPETQLIFWQGDVDAIVRDFTAKGLNFERGPTKDANGGVGALLRDPAGQSDLFRQCAGGGAERAGLSRGWVDLKHRPSRQARGSAAICASRKEPERRPQRRRARIPRARISARVSAWCALGEALAVGAQ